MSRVINVASGLRSLLRAQGTDVSPQDISAILAATVDVSDLYAVNSREYVSFGFGAAPTVGQTLFSGQTVPAGELWKVWVYDVSLTVAPATAVNMAPFVGLDGLQLGWRCGQYIAGAAGEAVRWVSDGPFLAGPGTTFGYTSRSVTGVPGTPFGAVIATRLRI